MQLYNLLISDERCELRMDKPAEKLLASGVFVSQKLGLPHCSRWSHWGEDNRKRLLQP